MKAPKVTLDKIEQEINLDQLFGVDLSENDALKEAIGQVLVDRMLKRTADGLGYGGSKLKSPYSQAYADSLEFKAAGKSKGKVNMELTGDMLASVNFKSSGNKITLEVASDQVPKAYNHITGDTVPKRNWFGFTKKELSVIGKEFSREVAKAKRADDAGGSDTLFNEILKGILDSVDTNNGGEDV